MRFKPGLLTRLSNIIIVQVIFIFTALAMIILFPGEDYIQDPGYFALKQKFTHVGAILDSACAASGAKSLDSTLEHSTMSALAAVFGPRRIAEARLYLKDPSDGTVRGLSLKSAYTSNLTSGHELEQNDLIDSRIVDYQMGLAEEVLIPASPVGHHAVYYYEFKLRGNHQAVLATVFEQAYVMASRTRLVYALVLLFLASTLVSLLAVYLLNKKFRDPLRRLIRGFEKTGSGELYYVVSPGGDAELDRLSTAFNTMSRGLWNSHTKLRKYNANLKKTNQMLRESQDHFSTLIASSPVGIVSATTDGVITVFNRKAEEVFGMSEGDACGMNVQELFRNPAGDMDWHPGESGVANLELLCKRNDNTLFPGYVTISSVLGRHGDVAAYMLIIRDISESKSFQEMMIRLDRYYTKGEMAGDIAHEINNFLAILSGNIELMPLFLKKGDMEKITRKLDLMKGTVDKIARFTDGLMDVNDGNTKFDKIDINQLVETVLAFLKPQNKFDEVEVVTNLGHNIPLVEVDVGQIQQLVVNLVYNATEALTDKEGGKHIWISTDLTDGDGEPSLSLVVEDDGPGVALEKESWLFKKRFTTKPTGHGIGLITCQKIIDIHNARISYARTSGAKFACCIPVNHRTSDERGEPNSGPEATAFATPAL